MTMNIGVCLIYGRDLPQQSGPWDPRLREDDGGGCLLRGADWIPASAGMTDFFDRRMKWAGWITA